ncbi:MAG TPA: hypothetical protein PLL06_13270, partial [Acidobacteriota bacterium]|nr:hypothetical protein [Acidobacteriota bacterium]
SWEPPPPPPPPPVAELPPPVEFQPADHEVVPTLAGETPVMPVATEEVSLDLEPPLLEEMEVQPVEPATRDMHAEIKPVEHTEPNTIDIETKVTQEVEGVDIDLAAPAPAEPEIREIALESGFQPSVTEPPQPLTESAETVEVRVVEQSEIDLGAEFQPNPQPVEAPSPTKTIPLKGATNVLSSSQEIDEEDLLEAQFERIQMKTTPKISGANRKFTQVEMEPAEAKKIAGDLIRVLFQSNRGPILEGLRRGTFSDAIKAEISKAKKEYEKRVPRASRQDFFKQELEEQLRHMKESSR